MRRHWQCHVKLTSTDERAGEHFQVKEVEGQQKFAPHSKNIPRPSTQLLRPHHPRAATSAVAMQRLPPYI